MPFKKNNQSMKFKKVGQTPRSRSKILVPAELSYHKEHAFEKLKP
jgi:hypothetical protein